MTLQLVLVAVSMNDITEFLLCKKIVYVVHYEIEICPIAHSAVRARSHQTTTSNLYPDDKVDFFHIC